MLKQIGVSNGGPDSTGGASSSSGPTMNDELRQPIVRRLKLSPDDERRKERVCAAGTQQQRTKAARYKKQLHARRTGLEEGSLALPTALVNEIMRFSTVRMLSSAAASSRELNNAVRSVRYGVVFRGLCQYSPRTQKVLALLGGSGGDGDGGGGDGGDDDGGQAAVPQRSYNELVSLFRRTILVSYEPTQLPPWPEPTTTLSSYIFSIEIYTTTPAPGIVLRNLGAG